MKHYVGLDVSLKETSVCVLDEEGSVVTEAKVLSEPEVLVEYLRGLSLRYERIGPIGAMPSLDDKHPSLFTAGDIWGRRRVELASPPAPCADRLLL